MVVTIGQRAESLSVGVGADHLLVSHHPGRGVVHLGEGEAHGSNSSLPEQQGKHTLSLSLLLAVFASDSSVCVRSPLLCEHKPDFFFLFPVCKRAFEGTAHPDNSLTAFLFSLACGAADVCKTPLVEM